jgi:hypothetical protein
MIDKTQKQPNFTKLAAISSQNQAIYLVEHPHKAEYYPEKVSLDQASAFSLLEKTSLVMSASTKH